MKESQLELSAALIRSKGLSPFYRKISRKPGKGIMYIAVTGGCGYIASACLPQLEKFASRVDFIDIRKPSFDLMSLLDKSKYTYINLDLTDITNLESVIKRYDVIIHLAALVGYPACEKDPFQAEKSNILTTSSLMRLKRPETKIIFSSTTSTYGDQSQGVDEKTSPHPNSVYGKTKHQAEELIRKSSEYVIFRYAGAFGCAPNMRHDNLIHDFVTRAVNGETLKIYESDFVRQFIHVHDMVEAILFAIKHWSELRGNTFNVGNPDIEITKRQLVESIARIYPFPFEMGASGTDLERRNYKISFQKITSLGFRPQRTLDTGIRDLVDYYFGELRKGAVNG